MNKFEILALCLIAVMIERYRAHLIMNDELELLRALLKASKKND